ncbi:MAG: DNA repair protein RecN [Ignavibacteria bacterium]|nr:DNA repair protein RecN [Ignavibacteria bacterium]
MIERLFIKNYLIIKEVEIEFSNGLNILTGETGAGKSIIIDALSLILGERADYSIIRNEDEKLIVEGTFNFSGKSENIKNVICKFLISNNVPLYNNNECVIIVRRELLRKGISRSFINDYPVSIGILKEFGKLIIDIHSQNEHQLLLDKNTHIEQLDEYIKQESKEFSLLLSEYNDGYKTYKSLVNELRSLIRKMNDYIERKEFLEFQLKEINSVNPQKNEDEILENELNKLENVEEINVTINNCVNILSGENLSILDGIHTVIKEIKKLIKYDVKFEDMIKELEAVYIQVKEFNSVLVNYISNVQFDERRIEEIRERLGQLSFLKKKYRMTIDELIEKTKKLNEELDAAANFDFEIENEQRKIEERKKHLLSLATKISEQRKNYSSKLEKSIKKYFNEIGLENAEFRVNFELNIPCEDEYFNVEIIGENAEKKKVKLSDNGIDDIEYLVNMNIIIDKPNKNNNLDYINSSNFLPLKKVVSGGEISRIMLSIKAVLASRDKIPILVFDEIDAGVSGRIAEKVGYLLKQLSDTHQVISITHLPQIAVFGDTNLCVTKTIANINGKKETVTFIKKLNEKEKIEEVAKLLSGEEISDASLKAAKEMIKNIKEKKVN